MAFPNVIASWKINIQAKTTSKLKNLWYIPSVTTEVDNYKKKADEQVFISAWVWNRWWQKVWSRNYPR